MEGGDIVIVTVILVVFGWRCERVKLKKNIS
jgi:hypothetical protein